MLALPDPASNRASDVVFTSKKSGVSVDDRAAKHYHRRVGCMYFHCFMFFMSCTFFISVNVVEFSESYDVFFPEGVQLQLDGWPSKW